MLADVFLWQQSLDTTPLCQGVFTGKGDSAVPNIGSVLTVSGGTEPQRRPAGCFQLPCTCSQALSVLKL